MMPVHAMINLRCSNYTVSYPLPDGTIAHDTGTYCWWEWSPDPYDPPYNPPIIPAPPGEPDVPNPNMCQVTLDNWPSGCSKLKRPFVQLNGCGRDGIFGALIPDNYGPVGFTNSCNSHDKCYSTYGQSKNNCDARLVNDLKEDCTRYYNAKIGVLRYRFGPDLPLDVLDEISRLEGESSVCWYTADRYGDAVTSMGDDAYAEGQKVAKCIKAHDDRDRYCGS